jgi:2-polyprenyl-3-methyl-5-hydroxy-6-metoxy-1,4-benzoquinol methylase
MQNTDIISTLKYLLDYFENLEKPQEVPNNPQNVPDSIVISEEIPSKVVFDLEPESEPKPKPKDPEPESVQVEAPEKELKEKFVINKDLFPKESHLLLDVLLSPVWPDAVPDFLICEDTEEQRQERAEGILDFISQSLNVEISRRKFLDFGCESGHVALEAAKKAQKSVGYDIKQYGNHVWEEVEDGCLLTTDLEKVKENGPYNFIMLYDVLDHVKDPVEVLKQVHSICAPNSVVFLRFHSWMSRHGAHLYRSLNKAWIQLVFSEEELSLMGLESETVQKYTRPIATQKYFIEAAGFDVIKENIESCIVEPFFKESLLRDRFLNKFENTFPEFQMSQSFNDYLIKIK